MHVLLIEPDIHLADAYRRSVEAAGHSVAHALTAQSALHAANTKLPDVVILELQLPGPNGVAFLQEFRSYDDWRTVPVVLHTYVLINSRLDIRTILENQYGVTAWLYKPQTTLAQLLSTVENHGNSALQR